MIGRVLPPRSFAVRCAHVVISFAGSDDIKSLPYAPVQFLGSTSGEGLAGLLGEVPVGIVGQVDGRGTRILEPGHRMGLGAVG